MNRRMMEPAGFEICVILQAQRRRLRGVDDGFRIAPGPSVYQQDQSLSSANQGKSGQEIRKSATGCNQDFEDPDPSQADGGES